MGGKPLPERLRACKRDLDIAIFKVEAQRKRVEQKISGNMKELKRHAKNGNKDDAREVAYKIAVGKDQVRRFKKVLAQWGMIRVNLDNLQMSIDTVDSLRNVMHVMRSVNDVIDPEKLLNMTYEFQSQLEKTTMGGEIVDRALDGAFASTELEEATEETLQEMSDNILSEYFPAAPSTVVSLPDASQQVAEDDLMVRLAVLNKES